MQDGGYTTYGVVTNYNVAPFFNFHQGFDHYAYLEPEFVLGANDTAAKLLFVQFLRQRIEKVRAASGQVEEGSAYRDAEAVNAAIVSFLDQQRPDGPFYVFAGYMDPHDPYYPHPYDGTGYSRAANQHPNPEEAPALRELYKGEIAFWDQHFGALMAELKRRGLYDDMTIVVTSDHGEEFMEHGGYWHGTTLYDEQVHVPLIVKLPGNRRGGQMIAHWVQSIDIMPTLLKEAGLQVPAGVQGEGLLSGSDTAFAEEDHEGNLLRALRIKRPGGVELKVIEANPGNPRGLEPYELYRLDRDPDEQRNLATEEPKELESVASALEAQGRVAERGRASGKSVDVAADAAAMQKLRALGYAEEDSPEPTSAGPTPN
jgi:arylsulfatase A-like enzyme